MGAKQYHLVATLRVISQLPSATPPGSVTVIDEPGQPRIVIQIEDMESSSPVHPSTNIREFATSTVQGVTSPTTTSPPSVAPTSPTHS